MSTIFALFRLRNSSLLLAALFSVLPALAQSPSNLEEQLRKRTEEMARQMGARRDGPVQRTNSLEQSLYQYLMSEIASQRGRPAEAIAGLMDLARKSGDPRFARRALEIAFLARQLPDAMAAASLWMSLEPQSAQARQAMAVLLANHGTLEAATNSLKQMLADRDKAPALYLQLNSLFARFTDKQAVLKAVQELAAIQPEMASAHFSVALALMATRNNEQALATARQAVSRDAKFQPAVVLTAQLLREAQPEAARAYLAEHLARHPDASEVRLAYARSLVANRSYADARAQYQLLEAELPNDPEIPYAAGLVALQVGDAAAADVHLRKTLSMSLRDRNPVLMALGQVEESRKNWDAALDWYRQVTGMESFVPSRLRMANVLVKQKDIAAGRRFLQEAAQDAGDQAVQMVLGESQLLRDARAFKEASAVLTAALEQSPDSTELLYDRAMVAEKLDDLAGLERDLRRVIELKPDYAHAYNALGYTLADRKERLPEALALIEKAVSLAPQDGFILDSLGWVHYRMGNLDKSLATLKQAYALRNDPEIAAHLGEVLWVAGQRDEALRLWQASQQEHPGNESLDAVIRRFRK